MHYNKSSDQLTKVKDRLKAQKREIEAKEKELYKDKMLFLPMIMKPKNHLSGMAKEEQSSVFLYGNGYWNHKSGLHVYQYGPSVSLPFKTNY